MRSMGLIMAAGLAACVPALSAWQSRRRGIDRWSLLPWDHLLILAAATLVALLALIAIQWRDTGWPG